MRSHNLAGLLRTRRVALDEALDLHGFRAVDRDGAIDELVETCLEHEGHDEDNVRRLAARCPFEGGFPEYLRDEGGPTAPPEDSNGQTESGSPDRSDLDLTMAMTRAYWSPYLGVSSLDLLEATGYEIDDSGLNDQDEHMPLIDLNSSDESETS